MAEPLYSVHLRDTHSHPGQWKSELQQFLLKYGEIPGSSCVCKAFERSIWQELDDKFKVEFIPRWIKQGISNVALFQAVAKSPSVVVCLLVLV